MSTSTNNSNFTINTHGVIDWANPVMWYEDQDPDCWQYDFMSFTFNFNGTLVYTCMHVGVDVDQLHEPGAHHMYSTYQPVLQGPSPVPCLSYDCVNWS